VTAGGVLLGLLVVSAVVGLILSAAGDVAGEAAVRAVAGILAITTGLVLLAILITLAQAVLLILQEEDVPASRSDPPPSGTPTSQSTETDTG
jgi:Na+/melibiose symporter-like transporter